MKLFLAFGVNSFGDVLNRMVVARFVATKSLQPFFDWVNDRRVCWGVQNPSNTWDIQAIGSVMIRSNFGQSIETLSADTIKRFDTLKIKRSKGDYLRMRFPGESRNGETSEKNKAKHDDQ